MRGGVRLGVTPLPPFAGASSQPYAGAQELSETEAARRRRRIVFASLNGFAANSAQTCIQHDRLRKTEAALAAAQRDAAQRDAFVMLPVRRRTPRCDVR
eukprot:2891888-Prymnesium_polylepis.1